MVERYKERIELLRIEAVAEINKSNYDLAIEKIEEIKACKSIIERGN